jgi:ABC-type Zn2+ transport system substrate-binding protein/surface adhesin
LDGRCDDFRKDNCLSPIKARCEFLNLCTPVDIFKCAVVNDVNDLLFRSINDDGEEEKKSESEEWDDDDDDVDDDDDDDLSV